MLSVKIKTFFSYLKAFPALKKDHAMYEKQLV